MDKPTPQQRHNCMMVILTKDTIQKKGFENLGHDYYMVYSFDTNLSQDYTDIPSLRRGNFTARPWFATWEELMN